jgi:hypothetical protein
LHRRNDHIPDNNSVTRERLAEWFFTASWNETYDLIEILLDALDGIRGRERFQEGHAEAWLNIYLEREMSGYRSVNRQLVPITSSIEIFEIEQASRPKMGFEGVAAHIDSALSLLGKKPEPDYRNSIKESISAVEAAAILVTGDKKADLDKALATLEQKGALHGALKSGVSKLYGYTSDEDGIRHAILTESNVGFAEAQFMLVACSAFCNFLIDSSLR